MVSPVEIFFMIAAAVLVTALLLFVSNLGKLPEDEDPDCFGKMEDLNECVHCKHWGSCLDEHAENMWSIERMLEDKENDK